MHTVRFTLAGAAPYSQSRAIQTPKKERETHQDYEMRVWRERCHVDEDNNVIIPPMSIKNCISEAAKFLSINIPGKGKSTYTKHFEAGLICMHTSVIKVKDRSKKSTGDNPNWVPVNLSDVKGELLFVPSDGRRGGGSRVHKMFPMIPSDWRADVEITVLDELITKDILKLHLERAGQYIGIGRFRPRNNGFYGRFRAEKIKWTTVADFSEQSAEAA